MFIEYQLVEGAYSSISAGDTEDIKCIAHYTSTEVLDFILTSATFRATNLLYLNDAEEYIIGIDYIKKQLENAPNTNAANTKGIDLSVVNQLFDSALNIEDFKREAGVYTISFSNNEDLLSQWITYAKESGVSIILDEKLLLDKENCRFHFVLKGLDEESQRYEPFFKTSSVLKVLKYIKTDGPVNVNDFNEKIAELYRAPDEFIENRKKVELVMVTQMQASYLKNDSFKEEHEIRASFYPCKHCYSRSRLKNESKIKYQITPKSVIRPYMEIQFSISEKENKDFKKACLPLKIITIGPSGTQQTIFDSVVHRLKYGDCKVYDYYNHRGDGRFYSNFVDYVKFVDKWMKQKGLSIDNGTNYSGLLSNDLMKELYDGIRQMDVVNETLAKILLAQWENSLNNGFGSINITPQIKCLLGSINRNFHFSKQGIIIKKSKIPYIF